MHCLGNNYEIGIYNAGVCECNAGSRQAQSGLGRFRFAARALHKVHVGRWRSKCLESIYEFGVCVIVCICHVWRAIIPI